MKNSYFNKNIKYLREKNNLTQNQLASKLKIDRSTISRWENDGMDATIGMALKVADVLSVKVEDLLLKDLSKKNK